MLLNYINLLKETFANPENLNLEQIQEFIKETQNYFETLQKTLSDGDQNAKEEAITSALEIKKYLDSQMQTISQMDGFDPKNLEEMMKESFNLQDEKVLGELSSLLDQFKPSTQNSNQNHKNPLKQPIILR